MKSRELLRQWEEDPEDVKLLERLKRTIVREESELLPIFKVSNELHVPSEILFVSYSESAEEPYDFVVLKTLNDRYFGFVGSNTDAFESMGFNVYGDEVSNVVYDTLLDYNVVCISSEDRILSLKYPKSDKPNKSRLIDDFLQHPRMRYLNCFGDDIFSELNSEIPDCWILKRYNDNQSHYQYLARSHQRTTWEMITNEIFSTQPGERNIYTTNIAVLYRYYRNDFQDLVFNNNFQNFVNRDRDFGLTQVVEIHPEVGEAFRDLINRREPRRRRRRR